MPLCVQAADITTIAGSGAAGFRDGPASTASFLMPEGLAYAANGDLYVADTAAQRIRRIATDGTVTTIAGSGNVDASRLWVPGGYADGPALSARFNAPTSVAVAADGDVIVADRDNHCLRVVSRGAVATYAGRCSISGSTDGPKASALFGRPTALTFMPDGSLYVADLGIGIRKIAPDGTVSTLPADATRGKHAREVTGLAPYGASVPSWLFATTSDGVFVIDVTNNSVARYYKSGIVDTFDEGNQRIEGYRMFGYPYAIAPISAAQNGIIFVYTDILTNAVRYFIGGLTGVAIGSPVENARFSAGGYREGRTDDARVNQPMGIVRRGDGAFVIADTGNRRIRAIRGIELRHGLLPEELADQRQYYRIVYIGDSTALYNQEWDQSVAGILERNLGENWKARGFPRPPRVYSIQLIADLNATKDYLNTYFASGLADMVVLQINSTQILSMENRLAPANLASSATQWQPVVTADLRSMSSTLGKSGVPLVVALTPMPYEISPVETSAEYLSEYDPASTGEYMQVGPLMAQAVAAAGVPYANAFPAFWEQEMLPSHPALYSTSELHFSVAGAALNAQLILNELLETKLWAKPAQTH